MLRGHRAADLLPKGGATPPSPYNAHDALYAAAYLCDSGARNGKDVPGAIKRSRTLSIRPGSGTGLSSNGKVRPGTRTYAIRIGTPSRSSLVGMVRMGASSPPVRFRC